MGHIPELAPILEDDDSSDEFRAYLASVQALEYRDAVIIEYCVGNTIINSCPGFNTTYRFEHVAFHTAWCGETETPSITQPPDNGAPVSITPRLVSHRPFMLSCPSKLVMNNVLFYDIATYRSLVLVGYASRVELFNFTMASSVLTRLPIIQTRESFLSINRNNLMRITNALFWNNTNQAPPTSNMAPLTGGVITAEGTLIASNIALVNNSVILHGPGCTIPMANASATRLDLRFDGPPPTQSSDVRGGAMAIYGAGTSIEHGWFIGNTAIKCMDSSQEAKIHSADDLPSGGAMHITESSFVDMIGVKFIDNRAKLGGAISIGFSGTYVPDLNSNLGDHVNLIGATFDSNVADLSGADIYVHGQHIVALSVQYSVFRESRTLFSKWNNNDTPQDTHTQQASKRPSMESRSRASLRRPKNTTFLDWSQYESVHNPTSIHSYFNRTHHTRATAEEEHTQSTPRPYEFENDIPWATSIAAKTQVRYSTDAYLRISDCFFDRPRLSPNRTTPGIVPITSPLITAQQFTLLSIYDSNISHVVTTGPPLISSSHVGTTTFVGVHVFHISNTLPYSTSSMIEVMYGGLSESTTATPYNTKAAKATFSVDSESDTHTDSHAQDPSAQTHHEYRARLRQEHADDRLNMLRSKGFFKLYPATDPLGSGTIFNKTYDPIDIASYARPSATSPLEDERVPSWMNDANDFSGAHQSESGYDASTSSKRSSQQAPDPNGFCGTTLSEPIAAGTNDHTPELLIFGFYIYDCSSANSVLTVMSLKSVKIIEAHWDLLKDDEAGPPSRKPWDFALYMADVYGYALIERTTISNSILPVLVLRSNAVEFGSFTLIHPINTQLKKFTKPALIVRDSASFYYHDSSLIGYKTVSRLSPVVVEQVRFSVYFKKISFIGNEGGQNGGALTLVSLSYLNTGTSSAVLDTCAFTHNTASSGGGIYSYGSLFIKDSTFIGNIANNGGAIFAASHTLCIYNSTFTDNFARNQGGAILSQATNTGIWGVEFLRGFARNAGGAVASSYGNLAISDSSFRDCKALDGGAVATIEYDPTIAPTRAPPGPGIPHSTTRSTHGSGFTDPEVDYKDHKETLKSKAAFASPKPLADFLLRIAYCNFTNNAAVDYVTFKALQQEIFPWPTALSSPKSHRGGAVFTCQITKVYISSTTFSSNVARTGGGVFVLGTPREFLLADNLFLGNNASYAGGAFVIFSQALSAREIPDDPYFTPLPHQPLPSQPMHFFTSRFIQNDAVFGAALWLTPDEGREITFEDIHWEGNNAYWGAAIYFSGFDSSIPVAFRSNITKNTATTVASSMFFNGPPVSNSSRLTAFCTPENGCVESGGTSRSFWGANKKQKTTTSATTGYSLQFTLAHGDSGQNTTYTPSAFNYTTGKVEDLLNSPLDTSGGNCKLVDRVQPFPCADSNSSSSTGEKVNCTRPPELSTYAGNMTLSVTLMDALGQVVDDLNTYITCFAVVENPDWSMGVLWKPGTVDYLAPTVSFILAVPSFGQVLDEATLYMPNIPRYEGKAVLVVGVENASTGSSSVSAVEPNRFLSTPLALVPVHLSGCAPGYGLQRYTADPVWAVCDVCPEGTYNFNGDGHCWLCADPSLPYSLVSCSFMNVRPMLGVFVATGTDNDFDIIICPYGFCSNCTAEAYTSFDHATSPLRGERIPASAYWQRTEHSKKDGFLAFLDYLTGSEDTLNTFGSAHYRKNRLGNYDWIIDELEETFFSEPSSSNASLHEHSTKGVSEAQSSEEPASTKKRSQNDPTLSQCPNGDCVLGRDPASPICGRCAPGYYESLAFDVCSLKVCKTRQTGAIIGLALTFVAISLLLHVVFYRYPAKTSISLFFLQVLPLLRVDLFSLLLENDKLRNVFCLARVTTPLTRILFFQLVPFYFAVSILAIFGLQRIFMLTYSLIRRCTGAKNASKKPRKMGRLQQDYPASTSYSRNVNTSVTDELYNETESNSDIDDIGDGNMQIGGSMEKSSQTVPLITDEDDSYLTMDSEDLTMGLLHKRSSALRHVSEWDQRESEPFFATSRLCRTLVAIASLTLIPGMRLFADLFHCIAVPGYKDKYWQPAPSITCGSLQFKVAQGITFPVMIVIIGGLVMLYARTISIYKKRVVDGILVPVGSYDALWLRHMAYFYEPFRATRYFWYLLHIAERVFLPLCVSFSWSNPGALHFSASLSLLISSLFQAFTWSYLDPWDNMASTLSIALLTLISLLRDSTFQGNVIDYASPRATFVIFLSWLAINLAFVCIEIGRFTVRFIQRRRRL